MPPNGKISNRRLVATEGADFYPTPSWGTNALLIYEKFQGHIVEPCCGDGAMSEVIKAAGYTVHSSDLHDRGYGEVKDFFDMKESVDNIITNPPFNIAEDILDHALSLATYKVCLLVRTAFLESAKRYRRFYSQVPPARVYVFSERLSMYPAGFPAQNGGTTSYSWMIWESNSEKCTTQLLWIPPGMKQNADKKEIEAPSKEPAPVASEDPVDPKEKASLAHLFKRTDGP